MKYAITVILFYLVFSCREDIDQTPNISEKLSSYQQASFNNTEELVFHSGFEGTTNVVRESSTSRYDNIKGIDNSVDPVGNWNNGLIPMFEKLTRVVYQNNDSGRSQSKASIVQDPLNPNNKVLQLFLNLRSGVIYLLNRYTHVLIFTICSDLPFSKT
ncbi:hypothetical protein [Olivibacter ginsenosidimutans]